MSDDQKAAVARVFGMTARDYDQSGVHFFSLFARRLVEHLQPRPGWHVVDVGTGRGAVVFALYGTTGRITAVDLAEPMIDELRADLAERGMQGVSLHVGDIEHLDLPDACADAVTASMVLFFLPNVRAGLGEIHRVLRPGGTLAFTVFGDEDPRWAPVYAAFNPYLPEDERLSNSRPVHRDLADEPGILDAVRRAGFDQVRCVEEVHPIRFADVEQWHTWSWSVGLRGTWLQIPENRREKARADVLTAVSQLAESDGSIIEQFAIRVVTGRRQA